MCDERHHDASVLHLSTLEAAKIKVDSLSLCSCSSTIIRSFVSPTVLLSWAVLVHLLTSRKSNHHPHTEDRLCMTGFPENSRLSSMMSPFICPFFPLAGTAEDEVSAYTSLRLRAASSAELESHHSSETAALQNRGRGFKSEGRTEMIHRPVICSCFIVL